MWLTLLAFIAIVMLNPPRANSEQYPRLPAAGRQDRVLIVAPHIDDEAIGAGGYAIDALANGAEVFVVFLTAGDCNRFSARLLHRTLEPTASNYLEVGKTRIAEAQEAMSLLGVAPDHFFILGYPDRGLRTMIDNPSAVVRSRGTRAQFVPYAEAFAPGSRYNIESVVHDLRRVISIADPTIVIAPVGFDRHPDHAATAEIVDLALREVSCTPARLGYLIHASRIATALVNRPTRALLPPSRMRSFTWTTYPLPPRLQTMKTTLLMTYKSQRPYVFLLRNAFVRKNELFFVYPPHAAAAASAPQRLPAQ